MPCRNCLLGKKLGKRGTSPLRYTKRLIDEAPDRKSVIEFLNTLQGFKNAYVLIYETEGLISILSEGEKEDLYGIAEKSISKEHEAYMGKRENTVAILPVEEGISKLDLQIEMECVRGALGLRHTYCHRQR